MLLCNIENICVVVSKDFVKMVHNISNVFLTRLYLKPLGNSYETIEQMKLIPNTRDNMCILDSKQITDSQYWVRFFHYVTL